jgi:hypothetical protein
MLDNLHNAGSVPLTSFLFFLFVFAALDRHSNGGHAAAFFVTVLARLRVEGHLGVLAFVVRRHRHNARGLQRTDGALELGVALQAQRTSSVVIHKFLSGHPLHRCPFRTSHCPEKTSHFDIMLRHATNQSYLFICVWNSMSCLQVPTNLVGFTGKLKRDAQQHE